MHPIFNSGEESFNSFDSFFEYLVREDSFKLKLTVIVDDNNGPPELTISINNQIILSRALSKGQHVLQIDHNIKNLKMLDLKISMSGKNPRDTLVENNQIIRDKFILIEKLEINNYDIITDSDLFYNKFKYVSNGQDESVKPGFWQNSTLSLYCDLPFSVWYQKNSNKNVGLSENLQYQDNKTLAEQQYHKLVSKLTLLK